MVLASAQMMPRRTPPTTTTTTTTTAADVAASSTSTATSLCGQNDDMNIKPSIRTPSSSSSSSSATATATATTLTATAITLSPSPAPSSISASASASSAHVAHVVAPKPSLSMSSSNFLSPPITPIPTPLSTNSNSISISDVLSPITPSPCAYLRPNTATFAKEVSFGFEGELRSDNGVPSPSSTTQAAVTPRELRQQRRRNIQSCMDSIEETMGQDDWVRLKRLAKQGAIHYQAEVDFLHTPIMQRSRSEPISSLAERYQRLRASTSPGLFRRPSEDQTIMSVTASISDITVAAADTGSSAAVQSQQSQQSQQSAAAAPTTTPKSPLSSNGSKAIIPHLATTTLAERAATPPRVTRSPTRIVVRSFNDKPITPLPTLGLDPAVVAAAAATTAAIDSPTQYGDSGIASLSSSASNSGITTVSSMQAVNEQNDDSGVSAGAPASAVRGKRGSDPNLEVSAAKSKKKNKLRGLFHRRRHYESEDEPEREDSAESRPPQQRERSATWTQRMQTYFHNILNKR